jgi:hypothetical protein
MIMIMTMKRVERMIIMITKKIMIMIANLAMLVLMTVIL